MSFYPTWTSAGMSSSPPVPPPTPAMIAALQGLLPAVGDRISVRLDPQLPALRVAKIGDQQSVSDWESAPMFQVEVWAEDELEAEQLAWDLKNVWPSATKQVFGPAVIHGRWVVQDPLSLPPNDDEAKNTDLARYLVTVAFRLTGALNG